MTDSFRINQRLSYDGALCTVRYIGKVGETKGEWLGVEWDDVLRGKHSGEHEGKRYFECLIPGAGSFIRPTRKPDPTISFIEGLRRKYTTEFDAPRKEQAIVLTANKVFEEVGFDKIIQKLSQLQNLKIIILDGLQIDRVDDIAIIRATCPNIEELDVSRNLFEKLEDIALVCCALPKLRSLRISGNRFSSLDVTDTSGFANITSLEISNVLMTWPELVQLLAYFPSVTTLIAPHNNLSQIPSPPPFPASLTAVDFSYNNFSALASLSSMSELPNLKTLIVSHNSITTLTTPPGTIFPALDRLDLAYNRIPFFSCLDDLPAATPHLNSLRISHNPLYSDFTHDEGHMLSIGRLPVRVTILNHSTITTKERENAEIWYLSRIAKEIAGAPEKKDEILQSHRRWEELCKLHGEPAVGTDKSGAEKTLAARVFDMEFCYDGNTVRRRVPKGTPVSTLRGMVGRWFGVPALGVRLKCCQEGEETMLEEVDDTRELGMYVELAKGEVRVVVEAM
ncbi:hypothetical protein BZA77DRAFT_303168 [Pyronema omphalodes]|nr:hypothetical protein BZA77DRAFT_303168 [Pyronema omphalodes]